MRGGSKGGSRQSKTLEEPGGFRAKHEKSEKNKVTPRPATAYGLPPSPDFKRVGGGINLQTFQHATQPSADLVANVLIPGPEQNYAAIMIFPKYRVAPQIFQLLSNLPVSTLISPKILPYIILYRTPLSRPYIIAQLDSRI